MTRRAQDPAGQAKESLENLQSKDALDPPKSEKTLQKTRSAERPASKAQSLETIKKIKKEDGSELHVESEDGTRDTVATDQGIGEKGLDGVERIGLAEMTKVLASSAEQIEAKGTTVPAEQVTSSERAVGKQETGLRGGFVNETMGSRFRSTHGKRSWGRAKADRVLRESRG